jgi:COMPASS component SWD1
MEFDPSGAALVTNSSDRIIRVFAVDPDDGTLILHHKFQDLVGRNPWSGISLSKDGEYVSAGRCWTAFQQ